MMAFSVVCAVGMGVFLVAVSGLFPMVYETSDEVRRLAAYMIVASAVTMPFCAYAHSSYFTLRSGGQVAVTLLFDSVYMWAVVLPVSFILSRFTGMNIHLLFAICQGTEIIKAIFGYVLLRRGTWVRQLVGGEDS